MQIEHECPQCAAPVTLDETDTLFSCSFCRTRLFMQAADYFRYRIPPRDPFLEKVFYVPYWRFKGMHFLCKTSAIENGLVDKTFIAIEAPGLPPSLGIRPQTLKLKFAELVDGAHYIRPAIAFDRSLAEVQNKVEYQLARTRTSRIVRISEDNYDLIPDVNLEIKEEHTYHEAFVSDTLSLIYAPFYVRDDTVHDGVTGDILPAAAPTVFNTEMIESGWTMSFLPTLCPNCGWDTISGKDSCTVFCRNCSSAWLVTEGKLSPVVFATMRSVIPHGVPSLYLPFWRVLPDITGIKLDSYADFIRFTNIPRALKPALETKPFYLWLPAFKTAPSAFLKIARQLTVNSPEETDTVMPLATVAPVNLPLKDACEGVKTLMSDLTLRKKIFFPTLPNITARIRDASLVLVPFAENNQELVQLDMNFSLFKNTLRLGQGI